MNDIEFITTWDQLFIRNIERMIVDEGSKLNLIIVENDPNKYKQIKAYETKCKIVRNQLEAVVKTQLPNETRINWPYKKLEIFYSDTTFRFKGKSKIAKEILGINKPKPQIKAIQILKKQFWRKKDIRFHVDITQYFAKQDLKQDIPYRLSQPFDKPELWFLMRLFLISSEFTNIQESDKDIGFPKKSNIKCQCGSLLKPLYHLMGQFKYENKALAGYYFIGGRMGYFIGDLNKGDLNNDWLKIKFVHQYYISISEKCKACGSFIVIYREKDDVLDIYLPLRIFTNYINEAWNFNILNNKMIENWSLIVLIASIKERQFPWVVGFYHGEYIIFNYILSKSKLMEQTFGEHLQEFKEFKENAKKTYTELKRRHAISLLNDYLEKRYKFKDLDKLLESE